MDQVHVIRHKVLVEKQSVRRVSRELGVSRNTVRKYLRESEPRRREVVDRSRPVWEAVGKRLEELLREWSGRTTAKQRLTGTRLHRQLVSEGYEVGETTVRRYVREKRRQKAEVYVPLAYRPGEVGQVDFFEVVVEVGGVSRRAWKFLVRLMYSGRDFAWLYERCDQVSFLDGHVRALSYFGGVPERLVYDNLSSAVKRRVGVERELTERFRALVSHYLFEACFARPGEGHDKGGVEARGKGIRLQHLTPVPRGESLSGMSEQLLSRLASEALGKRDGEGRTVEERFVEERERLRPLPEAIFEARAVVLVKVSRQAMIELYGSRYSVPSRWQSLQATAYVGAQDIRVACCGEEVTVARMAPGGRNVDYRHYLPELSRKPQALRQVAPQLIRQLGAPFERLWELLAPRYGGLEAARWLARLLGAMVEQGQAAVEEAVVAALESGQLSGLARPTPPTPRTIEIPAGLASHEVASVAAADYDALLRPEVAS
jgi:transposase